MLVVQGGGEHFAAAINGMPNPMDAQYFQQQFEAARQYIGNRTDEIARGFYEGTQRLYEQFNNTVVMRRVKNTLNQIKGIFQDDIIRTISTISDFQIATPVMQRWIMAQPLVRAAYNDQSIDGYSETYIDNEPGFKGRPEARYDYRRVMDGIIQTDENGHFFEEYPDLLLHPSDELDPYDKFRILETWNNLNNLFLLAQTGKTVRDPTSVWDEDIAHMSK